jgi:FkbM family methyltransferase
MVRPSSALGGLLRLPLKLVPSEMEIRVWRGPLKGLRWISSSGNASCWMGTYEHEKQQLFQKLLGAGQVLFDLGANVGFFSLLASRLVGDAGRVVAVEPASRNIAYLRRHIALNGIGNIDLLEAAVSSEEGFAFFDSAVLPTTGHLTESTSGCRVSTVVLDKLVSRGSIPKPHLIKCDIEGAEYEALRGAVQILQNCRPIVLLATHGTGVHQRCCGLLRDLCYRIESLDQGLTSSKGDELIAYPLA